MTVIKQKGVGSAAHLQNLANYLNDERALMRGTQNLSRFENWERECGSTRRAYGHDEPGKAGAKTTYMYHQVISFLPEECSCSSKHGKMTPEACMAFAREWLERNYPQYEAAFCLHEEKCKADGTSRYSVHIALNRTNLETGCRLCEGLGTKGKSARASHMRELDERWGLRQLERGNRNSMAHAMQPSKAERAMAARGAKPEKQLVREKVRQRIREIAREAPRGNRMRELAKRLETDGIKMSVSANNKQPVFQAPSGRKYRGYKLGRGFSLAGIARGLGMESARQMGRAMDDGMERDR